MQKLDETISVDPLDYAVYYGRAIYHRCNGVIEVVTTCFSDSSIIRIAITFVVVGNSHKD